MAEMPRMRKRWLKAFSDFREDANRWMEQGSGWESLQPEEEIRGHKRCTERGRGCQTEILEMKPQFKKKKKCWTVPSMESIKLKRDFLGWKERLGTHSSPTAVKQRQTKQNLSMPTACKALGPKLENKSKNPWHRSWDKNVSLQNPY